MMNGEIGGVGIGDTINWYWRTCIQPHVISFLVYMFMYFMM